ncbi:MAG: ribosome assembly factor SBDS [Candidatus Methanospirareceae archaeon]
MVSLENAVIARYKHGKKIFEILVDPEGADKIRSDAEVEIEDVLAADEIFVDAAKGRKATGGDLIDVFSTTDVREIARKIIKEGDLQLTTEQRRRKIEEKRKMVVERIAKISINPQTNTPHTTRRIEIAMNEAKVHIDPFKSIDELVSETVKALRPIIPIKIEETEIAIKVPAAYTGRVYELKRKFGVVKEEWQDDGSFIGVVRVPSGMREELFSFLNRITRGAAETKIVK